MGLGRGLIGIGLTSLLANPALAQIPAAEAPPAWTFTLGITTDYVRRGTTRGQDDIEGVATAQWSRGLVYANVAANTAAVGDSDYEVDVSVGLQPTWAGWAWQIAASRISYFGGSGDVDNWQVSAQATRAFGPATVVALVGGSPDYEGAGEEAVWGQTSLAWALTPKLSADAVIGFQDQVGAPDYGWWQAGITYALTSQVSADLHWYDTDNAVALGESGDGQAVLALTWNF